MPATRLRIFCCLMGVAFLFCVVATLDLGGSTVVQWASGEIIEKEIVKNPATNFLKMKRWSPYAVGVGIGILSWFTFLLSNKPIGCSTAYVRTTGMIEKSLRGARVDKKPYYRMFAPVIEWQWMLVLGVILGAFISARLSGEFRAEWVPSRWVVAVGNTPILRWAFAFIGGAVMMMGARWAGGCTSGHGISGALQLSVSSWMAAICFFIGGIATAMLIFKFLLA